MKDKRRMVLTLVLLLVVVEMLLGCGESVRESTATVDSRISKVSVSPEEMTLTPRGSYQFQAALYDSSNNVVTDESIAITWTVSGSIGTITQNGTFAATAVGAGQVTALAGGLQDVANIEIVDSVPPFDFNLITTTTNEIITTETYTISWARSGSDHNGLKEYQVMGRRVSQMETFGVLKSRIAPEDTLATVDLQVDGVWELKVRAIDNKGLWRDSDGTSAAGDVGISSRILTVLRDTIPPNIFIVSHPWQDGQKIDANDVRIVWEEARDENLDHYELAVGTNPNDVSGSAVYTNVISASATREVWLRDLPRGKYYIYMSAFDKAGHYRRLNGKTDIPAYDKDLTYAWKAKWPMFEVGTVPPQTFSLGKPYNGQYFDGRNVRITWNKPYDSNLDRYELVIGTNRENIKDSVVYAVTLEADTNATDVTIPGGICYIYLAAFDEDGNWRDLKGKTNVSEYDSNVISNWPMFEIDHEPPTITFNPLYYPPVTNPIFSPNGDGIDDSTTINYCIGDDSYWKVNYLYQDEVRIETKIEIIETTFGGFVVRSWQESLPPGWHSKEWDGKNNHGLAVVDTNFIIKITAIDKAMNISTDESQSVYVIPSI